jgi:hypothetical protein
VQSTSRYLEEIIVWRKLEPDLAVRYCGFRNIDTDAVWFCVANFVNSELDEVRQGHAILGYELIQAFLANPPPEDGDDWKLNVREALKHFIARNPDLPS